MMAQEFRPAGLLRAQVEHCRRRIPVIQPFQPVQAPPAFHVGNRLDVKYKQVHCLQYFKICRKDANNAEKLSPYKTELKIFDQ
jgi:hypothetical protein